MTLPGGPMGLLRPILAAALLAGIPAAAVADRVTLTSPDGFRMSGTFRSYDGEFYRLETEAGFVTIAGEGLTCEGVACPGDMAETVAFAPADSSVKRLMVALLRAYADARGWHAVETHDVEGLVKLSMGEGPVSPRLEAEFGERTGAWRVVRDPRGLPPTGWRDTALAFDALVPAVSVENPVTGLTLLGVRAALAGEFADWIGLGGGSDPVTVHWNASIEGPLVDRYRLAPGADALRHAAIDEASDAVARQPGGLGLLTLSEIGSAVPLVVTGPCGRGAIGVASAIRTGDYPLSEAVLLRFPARRPGPQARAFLAWLDSPGARAAVRRAGFVDLGVSVVPDGRDGRQEADPLSLASSGSNVLAAAAVDLADARRLDVAVRFRDGSSLPDRTSRIQIDRLAEALASGIFDGQRLIFAGFSDANGSASTNLQLSRRRAEAIRSAVITQAGAAADRVVLEARGFGEAMPVACNGVDWGESLNRRVEVWLAAADQR